MPEPSPFLNPSFLLTVAVMVVGLIAWLVRLESKTNANKTEIDRNCKDFNEAIDKIERQQKELQTNFLAHVMNANAHYNEQAMNEFKTSLDRRFLGVETSLKEIKLAIERKH